MKFFRISLILTQRYVKSGMEHRNLQLYIFTFSNPHIAGLFLHTVKFIWENISWNRIEANTLSSCCRRRKRVSENLGTLSSIIQGISLMPIDLTTTRRLLFILVHTKHGSSMPMCLYNHFVGLWSLDARVGKCWAVILSMLWFSVESMWAHERNISR